MGLIDKEIMELEKIAYGDSPDTKNLNGYKGLIKNQICILKDKTKQIEVIEIEKIENWIKNFNKEMTYFCKKIDWKTSFLDSNAIQFMNSGLDRKSVV